MYEHLADLPIGYELHVEGVIGGTTKKVGEPFLDNGGEWRMRVQYFDYGTIPHEPYNEYCKAFI